ncbi:C45 family autoproteolytic acyltransferase/hydolase [Solidesulfovibrio alcoholivorans]|uniref:C45 family autoproteolytic acyltransferase/hydolase n=1 Tax=Solidesulfovibrio alcoholivorans TaxID=81406 RepID=UPI000497D865|nr:C45 family autoproteolytic acyltransferase/hydolase [Solidesulfovibrio alcoholivorans]
MSQDSSLVTIEDVDGLYFKTTLDFTSGSHFEVGQAYAQAIVESKPTYGAIIDNFLLLSVESAPDHPQLATLVSQAKNLIADMPQQYVQELLGMTTVFNYPIDKLGDGILSSNELLLFEVVHDVIDPGSCSATAVSADVSATGATLVGRNLDWYDMPGVSELHNVQLYDNADATYDIVGIGILGQFFPISAFSEKHISGAVLDSDMQQGYFTTEGATSYLADMRYALEHCDTLDGVAYYLLNQQNTHSYIGFLADENTAAVLENDLEHPEAKGLRHDDSVLRDGTTWDYPGTLVAVNAFMLPGTTDNFTGAASNEKRFASYETLFESKLTANNMLDMRDVQDIISYSGTDGSASGSGAIYRATSDYPTYQSYVLDMGSLALVACFGPTSGNPPSPNYVQVFASSPF